MSLILIFQRASSILRETSATEKARKLANWIAAFTTWTAEEHKQWFEDRRGVIVSPSPVALCLTFVAWKAWRNNGCSAVYVSLSTNVTKQSKGSYQATSCRIMTYKQSPFVLSACLNWLGQFVWRQGRNQTRRAYQVEIKATCGNGGKRERSDSSDYDSWRRRQLRLSIFPKSFLSYESDIRCDSADGKQQP